MSEQRIFFGRIIVSIGLYVLFMILSTVAVFSGTLDEQPFLLGGLLIGAVLLLPRTPRHPRGEADVEEEGEATSGEDATAEMNGDAPSEEAAARKRGVRKWLTWTRVAYFIIAVALWFGLPELV